MEADQAATEPLKPTLGRLLYAQGMTEEEVAEAATAAAQEAANNSSVLATASQHGNDAQSRYYALAHRQGSAADLIPDERISDCVLHVIRRLSCKGLPW